MPRSIPGLANATTRKCFHLGFTEEQGLAWAEDRDGALPWPASQGSICEIFDELGQSNLVIEDEATGLPFIMNVREAPANSRMKLTWKDKYDPNYPTTDSGTDVACTVGLPEDEGDVRGEEIEHGETRLTIRPARASDGLPAGFQVNAKSYEDGSETSSVSIAGIDTDAEMIYDRFLKAKGLSHEFSTTTSGWRLMGAASYYKQIDKSRLPSAGNTTENAFGLEFSLPSVWLSRGNNLLLNRATGQTLSGSVTATQGADWLTQSGMNISSPVLLANSVMAAGTLMLWDPTGAYAISGVTLATYGSFHDGSLYWYLRYAQGAIPASLQLPVGTVFDLRLYNSTISAAALAHYFNAMKENGGRGYLP